MYVLLSNGEYIYGNDPVKLNRLAQEIESGKCPDCGKLSGDDWRFKCVDGCKRRMAAFSDVRYQN